jgi:hypothetical protein
MEQEIHFTKKLELPEAYIMLRDDGIVHVKFKQDVVIDIDTQMKLLDIYNDLLQHRLSPFLFEAEPGVTITKEARDNAHSIEDVSPLGWTAVLVKNIAHALIANFYLKVNKPKRPYKVFHSREEALEWLKQFA